MTRNPPRIAACPVCRMPVETAGARFTAREEGEPRLFCAEGCRRRWLEERARRSRPRSRWGRYLDRLARANQAEFGPSGPGCH
jgi:YHS domain-containing protein